MGSANGSIAAAGTKGQSDVTKVQSQIADGLTYYEIGDSNSVQLGRSCNDCEEIIILLIMTMIQIPH